TDPRQRSLGGPAKIERRIKGDQVRKGPPRHRQTSRGSRRDDHLPTWPAAGHLTHQRLEQENLADAHGVKPETGPLPDPPGRITPEFFPQTFAVFARSDDPVRQQGSKE